MPHGAIIGTTTSGKTFLARQMAREFKAAGVEVIALHKPREPWGKDEVTWQTSHVDLFLAKIEERNQINRQRIKNGLQPLGGFKGFMELSDAAAAKYDERVRKLYTEGRHDGHVFDYLAQRGVQVHPDIRENCERLYLFACLGDAAKEWSKEFNDVEIKKAVNLPRRYFVLKTSRFTPAKVCTLNIKSG